MATVKVYNVKGEALKDRTLEASVFDVRVNPSVIHQVIVAMDANKRQVLAHTKTRGDVRGGGKKPWKQKGTGRARAGSIRSPLWIGGGVTFGPRNDRNFVKKINKKMRRAALVMALSDRVKGDTMKVVDTLGLEKKASTKTVVTALKNFAMPKSVLLVSETANPILVKSAMNLEKVEVIEARNLNVAVIARYKYMILTDAAIDVIEKTWKKVSTPKPVSTPKTAKK